MSVLFEGKDIYTQEAFNSVIYFKYDNNMRKQMQRLQRVGWDYLCIHVLFFEYE